MRSAKDLHLALAGDPQMALPKRPRLPEDLAQVRYDRRTLVFLGTLGEMVLRGGAVENLLPRLLPVLDGRRSSEELAREVPGFSPSQVLDALHLLSVQGLLEEGDTSEVRLGREDVQAFRPQLRFFSRYLGLTRACRHRYEVLERLRTASVLLLAGGPGALAVGRELIGLGLGHLRVLPLDGGTAGWTAMETGGTRLEVEVASGGPEAVALEGCDLLLLVEACRSELLRVLNRRALDSGISFLPCVLGPGEIVLGPAVFPGESACCECAELQGLLTPEAEPFAREDLPLVPEEEIGAARAALFALAILTRFAPVTCGNAVHRLDLETLEMKRDPVYSLPGCPGCHRLQGYSGGRDFLIGNEHLESFPALFHFNSHYTEFLHLPRSHQQHYAVENLTAALGAYKEYPGHAAVRPEQESGPELGRLLSLLELAAGFQTRGPGSTVVPTRVAPSAGGLASQTLYLVNLALPGLEPGLYYFSPLRKLLLLRSGDLTGALQQCLPERPPAGRAAAALIQTAAYERVAQKYQAAAYRLVLYDAGAMLGTLSELARPFGLRLRPCLDFLDDLLCEMLEVHPPHELPLWVAWVDATATPAEPEP